MAVAQVKERHAAALPKNDGRGALAEVILREAAGRLAMAACGGAAARRVLDVIDLLSQAGAYGLTAALENER
ncbi:hypothetical protein [Streptomyces galilaeus]|uniref:Uncharacterized protein n=1 Tax=Streptomyces galilaeus TaxID=33899 RepID=A0ABW9IUY9_STRGJ